MNAPMRTFDTGATRNVDVDKLDYEGFLSPRVLKRFAEYMHANRKQADGNLRDADNWQKGIPLDAYAKSAWRHFMDFWHEHRGISTDEGMETALCALMFNIQGYLDERLKARNATKPPKDHRRVATPAEMAAYGAPAYATDCHGELLLIGDTVRIVDPSHDDVLCGFGKGSTAKVAGKGVGPGTMVCLQGSHDTRWFHGKQIEVLPA